MRLVRLEGYRLPYLTFFGVWLGAVLFLAFRGEWGWARAALGEAVALGIFVALTVWATRGAGRDGPGREAPVRPGQRATGSARRRLAAQLAVAAGLAVLAVLRFADVPVWSGLVGRLYAIAELLPIPRPNYFVNPVLYVVIPGALVLALGAGWREIGFGRGRKAWTVSALWTVPVLGIWIHGLAVGRLSVGRIASGLVANAFQNGFGEEFLWRGVIQTRLARLWSPEWGLVLASLGFGLWHIDSIQDWAGSDVWLAAALNVTVQAPMGLALGVIFERTRNLLAPSIVHVVANTVQA